MKSTLTVIQLMFLDVSFWILEFIADISLSLSEKITTFLEETRDEHSKVLDKWIKESQPAKSVGENHREVQIVSVMAVMLSFMIIYFSLKIGKEQREN